MSNMKKASVREVQHNLAKVLQWVADGEEVQIVRRDEVVGRIVPPDRPSRAREWPNFVERAERIWGRKPKGKPVSRIISDDRKERV
jgi:antitoxin (DNA-binding transcriptional repressor) of toxin-antitoxin stability system